MQFLKKLKVSAQVEGDFVLLTANCLAKGVVISVPIEGDDAMFDDNFIEWCLGGGSGECEGLE